MKKHLLKLCIAVGLIALSADLRAFTAVTSGLWSDANTWGGVGPGATVTNQDIIIPSGITVDFDMDVTFNGALNTFLVAGTLNGSMTNNLTVSAGTVAGAGTIFIRKIELGSAAAYYSFTGSLNVDIFRNAGATVNLASVVTVNDSLDLEAGSVTIGTGSTLVLGTNAAVRVNTGSLMQTSGTFIATGYDVWYVGSSTTAGTELSTNNVNHVYVMLTGINPSLMLSNETSINMGIHLNSGNLNLNNYRINLYGDFTHGLNSYIISSGTAGINVAGSGMLTNGLMFSAGSSLDELTIDRDSQMVILENELTVTGTINLVAGTLHIGTNGALTMALGSNIVVTQGKLTSDGIFDGTQFYDVSYVGGNYEAGVELTGPALHDLTINLTNSTRALTLSMDATTWGAFNLMTGIFDIDSSMFTVQGSFDQNGTNSNIRGDMFMGRIKLSMNAVTNDTIWFMPNGLILYSLVLDLPVNRTVTLGTDLWIYHDLIFLRGRIDVGNNTLTVGALGDVYNANQNDYIITSNNGSFQRYVYNNNTPVKFPVGTQDGYAPIELTQTSAGTSSYVHVFAMNDVWLNGETGTDLSATGSVVDMTWKVYSDSAITYDMTVQTSWRANLEVNSFDRTQASIRHYTNSWDWWPPSVALFNSPDSTYYLIRSGIMDEGYFAVADVSEPLGVPENETITYGTYPNPTTDFVTVAVENPANDMLQYELYDATGRRVMTMTNTGTSNQIDMRTLEQGSYILRVTNLKTNEVTTQQVIKS